MSSKVFSLKNHRHFDYIVGVDEAGRGPIAGPVAVAAFALNIFKFKDRAQANYLDVCLGGARDSKTLSISQRDRWFDKIETEAEKGSVAYASSLVSAKIIDRLGIVAAVRLALRRSLEKLGRDPKRTLVLLDGLLKAPPIYCYQQTIIRGDKDVPVISLASIVAKVVRDRQMIALSKKYPAYSFETHKGYGTKMHYALLRRYGPCEIHRKSFLKGHIHTPASQN